MREPNRLQSESHPNVMRDAPTADTGVVRVTRAPDTRARRPTPGRALLGLAAQVIGGLIVLAWLVELSPLAAIAWLGLVVVGWSVQRIRRAKRTEPSLARDVYESLSARGEQAATELSTILRDVLIVLAWGGGATGVAIAFAIVGANLPEEARWLTGLAILVSFLGMLILGPIWTVRRLHRSSPDGAPTQARDRTDTAHRDLTLGSTGFLVGVVPLAVSLTTVVVFGVLLEYDPWWIWLVAFGPPPVIVFLAAGATNPGWQRGFVAGLVLSWVGSMILGAAVLVFIPTTAIAYLVGWRRRVPSSTDLDPRIVLAGLAAAAILNGGWVWLFPRLQSNEPGAGLPITIETISSLPSLSGVTVGQCFSDVLAGTDLSIVLGERIMSCAEPHRGEMFGTATYPAAASASFPSGTSLDDYAGRLCASAFQEYVGTPADSSMLAWAYTTPSEETWTSDGDRWIGCWVESTPPAAPLVGSVKATGR